MTIQALEVNLLTGQGDIVFCFLTRPPSVLSFQGSPLASGDTHKSKTLTCRQLAFPLFLLNSSILSLHPSVFHSVCLFYDSAVFLSDSLFQDYIHFPLQCSVASHLLCECVSADKLRFSFWQWVFLGHWGRRALKMETDTGSLAVLLCFSLFLSLSLSLSLSLCRS